MFFVILILATRSKIEISRIKTAKFITTQNKITLVWLVLHGDFGIVLKFATQFNCVMCNLNLSYKAILWHHTNKSEP